MNAPTIQIKNAHLSYQGALLFANFNLTLQAGQWTCLLGPSGIGKTTLLKLLAGLTQEGPGDELQANITVDDKLPLAQRITYMAQQDGLMPWLNVVDNVLVGAKLRGEKKNRERVRELLGQVGLDDALHNYPNELSGGMRQRVALVRTLIEERPIVLMDEPFSALDMITRLRLQELACELLADRTVLLITHDPLEALRLGDSVFVMSGRPATLSQALKPEGQSPRAVTDEHLLHLQGELLARLECAQERVSA